MVRISRNLDYALMALAYLAGRPGQCVPARQIADDEGLPPALLARVCKLLQHNGLLIGCRGSNGGYRLGGDLSAVTLPQLARMLGRGKPKVAGEPGEGPLAPPLVALRAKLDGFLDGVRVDELVLPGVRVDVAVERIGMKKAKQEAAAG
jgi:hypothetical protein